MKKSLTRAAVAAAVAPALVLAGAVPADAAARKDIVMTVSSSSGSRADIDWYSNFNNATLEDHSLPWTKRVSTAGYVHSIGASNHSGDEVTLSCTITYRGKVVRHHTVHGTDASVNCEFDK